MSFVDLEKRFTVFIQRFSGATMNIASFLAELRTLSAEAGRFFIQEIRAERIIPPDPTPPWLEVILQPEMIAKRLGRRPPTSTNMNAEVEAILSQIYDMYSDACVRHKSDYGMPPPFACIFYEALTWLSWRYPLKKVNLPTVKINFADEMDVFLISDFYGVRGINRSCASHFEIAMACRDACSLLAKEIGEKVPISEKDEPPETNQPLLVKKRSTGKGDAQEKIIAALTEHHKYSNGSCLNFDPIGNNKLARKASVAISTVSVFFKKEFLGYPKYKVICCSDTSKLTRSLKLLNKEYSPHHLYGKTPPGERSHIDEEE